MSSKVSIVLLSMALALMIFSGVMLNDINNDLIEMNETLDSTGAMLDDMTGMLKDMSE